MDISRARWSRSWAFRLGEVDLLSIIGGLLAGDAGHHAWRANLRPGAFNVVDVRRELVGWIFQDFHLLDNLTAADRVAMALTLGHAGSSRSGQKRLGKVVWATGCTSSPTNCRGANSAWPSLAPSATALFCWRTSRPETLISLAEKKMVQELYHDEKTHSILMVFPAGFGFQRRPHVVVERRGPRPPTFARRGAWTTKAVKK